MNDIQSNLSPTATLGIEESGRYGEVRVLYDKFFFRKYNMFIVLSCCLLYPIMIIQSYIRFRDEILKKKT